MGLAFLCAAACPLAAAEHPDTHYLRIMEMIDEADALVTKGSTNQATLKYREAHGELLKFKQANPVYNPKVIAFRQKYVTDKIVALTRPPPAGFEPAATGTEAKGGEQGATVTKGPARAGAPQVKLLEAGAEPRQVLRLKPKAGDKQLLGMKMKIDTEATGASVPPEAQGMKFPEFKMDLEVTVKAVAPNGDTKYEVVLENLSFADEPGMKPEFAASLKSALSDTKKLSGTGTISSRGFGKGVDLQPPPGPGSRELRPSFERLITSMARLGLARYTTGFPETAVGLGARWEVKEEDPSGAHTATNELTSIEGDVLSVKSSTRLSEDDESRKTGKPGKDMNFKSMSGSVTGTFTFNLSRIMPSEGTMLIKMGQGVEGTVRGKKESMNMNMSIRLQLESKP